MKKSNKLFRDAFKARHKLDMAVVDRHFENLCKAAEDFSKNISQSISVITPFGVMSFQQGLVDFTFKFNRIMKGKKVKKGAKKK